MAGSGATPVRLERVQKQFVRGAAALDDVTLEIRPGEFFSLLGPSGSGKTTLLRMIAGFEEPTAGRIWIGERLVNGVSARDRDIAMVFQDYALYPHMSVFDNIAFNLKLKGIGREEIRRRVHSIAELLHVEGLLTRKPAQLSGGERQRVALGRALVRRPKVFLLDEPLSNLDLKLREEMRTELRKIHREIGVTTIFVTHDQAEAMTLSDRLAVLNRGQLQQVGSPDEIYALPDNVFVARFIGSPSINLIRMHVSSDGTAIASRSNPADAALRLALARPVEDRELILGVRPHDLTLVSGPDGSAALPVRIEFVEHLGRSNYVVCSPRAHAFELVEQETLLVETPPTEQPPAGTHCFVAVDPARVTLFSAATRQVVAGRRESGLAVGRTGVQAPSSFGRAG